MENAAYLNFLDVFHLAMWIGVGISLFIALVIYIGYKIKYASKKDYKDKFDLASSSEINNYLRSQYAIAVAVFFAVNTTYQETVELSPLWVFIRFFISFCLGTLHVYVAYLVFKYYYPGPLQKKLERLRFTPRVNPSTGNTMKLLSEAEEDAYLDEGMQAEEDVFSVDYDVWIDPETKETKIEKYQGHLSALECDRCGFQTLRLKKEEVLREPSETRDGELQKEYECSYCGRIKRKTVKLASEISPSAVKNVLDPKAVDKEIQMVRIEVHSVQGEIKSYDFQNREQAKKFIEEFTFSKLKEDA